MNVFILCSGSGSRWNDYLGIPKQKLRFGGECLLDRAARLIQSEWNPAALYTVSLNSKKLTANNSKNILLNESTCLVQTIAMTEAYWRGRNVFLLGDVFYSLEVMNALVNSNGSLFVVGRPWPSKFVRSGHGELFGLTFDELACQDVRSVLATLVEKRQAPRNLWNVYQEVAKLPLGSSICDRRYMRPMDDITNDIDTPVDFSRRADIYEAASRQIALSR